METGDSHHTHTQHRGVEEIPNFIPRYKVPTYGML